MIDSKLIQPDHNQLEVINWLDAYSNQIKAAEPDFNKYAAAYSVLTANNPVPNKDELKALKAKYHSLQKIKSVYIWGDPGCGKSFMMEKFF